MMIHSGLRKCHKSICFKNLLVLFTLALASTFIYGQQDPDPDRFVKEFVIFDSLDYYHPVPENSLLFLGSSSIRMWKDAEEVFKSYNAVNRGFGGSHMSDVLFHFNRLILRYRPEIIILYEGDNDIAGNKSPDQILNDFIAFDQKMQKYLPETKIAFVSIKPSISRWNLGPGMQETNALINEYMQNDDRLQYIDVWKPMINLFGKPKKRIFLSDNLHMNNRGYKIWQKQVQKYLKTVVLP